MEEKRLCDFNHTYRWPLSNNGN